MRYDTPIYFRTVHPGEYNQETGNYDPGTVEEVQRWASVTSSGIQTMNLIYGEIKEGSLTIRLQNHYKEPFSNIRIGEKLYRVDSTRPLRVKQTFVVSEVQ